MSVLRLLALACLPAFLLVGALAIFVGSGVAAPQDMGGSATYVGGAACAACHRAESERWKTSHHALAMQPASGAAVLGDFSGAVFEHAGAQTIFSRSGDKFAVRTDGPEGKPRDYELAYTFGVYPLQQYLIAMPGGRLQAFGIAWDARDRSKGGQRWFDLHPDRNLTAGDPLHWTGRDQTWNYMCADCHSTDLKKNFDLAANTYATSWSDVDVSCEACHGPGSRHVAWAQAGGQAGTDAPATDAAGTSGSDRMGLTTWLRATDRGRWEMNPETGIARRSERLVSAELDACAGCHARRKAITGPAGAGTPFLDAYAPALLEPGLYHADGQIDGEVFEYGSFVQSAMHRAGVTCSDCHEPHGLALRAEGNALCAQCHMPAKFDTAEHHHHLLGTSGAQCTSCHMPAKTYMVIHERRDHSFRVPRPDLSATIGTPNTCNACHADKPPAWAAQAVAQWFPDGRQTRGHYGMALHAGRTGAADAEGRLDALILDPAQPAIARASALLLLPRFATPASDAAMRAAIADPDPLVRAAAPRGFPAEPNPAMIRALAPLLSDPVRLVRIAAARALTGADQLIMTAEQRRAFDGASDELMAAEMVDADRPEAHLNLGLLYLQRRQPDEASAEYRTALRLDPDFVPAMVNLADLDRMRGMDREGEAILRKALAIAPESADVQHALGLLLVRRHDLEGALPLLRRAGELAPENARYAYVYAIAANAMGFSVEALALLRRVHEQHPADRDVLVALVAITRDKGDAAAALRYARELALLTPDDPQLQRMILELERRQSP